MNEWKEIDKYRFKKTRPDGIKYSLVYYTDGWSLIAQLPEPRGEFFNLLYKHYRVTDYKLGKMHADEEILAFEERKTF